MATCAPAEHAAADDWIGPDMTLQAMCDRVERLVHEPSA